MADNSFTSDDAVEFYNIFNVNSKKASEIAKQIDSVLMSPYKNKKDLYIAAKAAAINAENTFRNTADKIDDEYRPITLDPCVSAGFYLNQIMWDIDMAKDAENRLDNIDIVDLKNFFIDFKFDLEHFSKYAGKCSSKIASDYQLYQD